MICCTISNETIECEDIQKFKEYEEIVYRIFIELYEQSRLFFRSVKVTMKHYPPEYDKRSGFYHLTCENYDQTGNEEDRIPNLDRYRKIKWADQLISYCETDGCENFLVWENERKGNTNVLLYCKDIDYLVVLGKRQNYFLLVTAYPIHYDHTRDKLMKEYARYKSK